LAFETLIDMNIPHFTRRQWIGAASGTLLHAAVRKTSRLSLEGYIWQNLASSAKRPLADMIDELFATAPYAGFENIELNQGFFVPALRDRVLGLVRKHGLHLPSVYVGGGMHEQALAERTTAHALELGSLCKKFGCEAIVHNPDSKPRNALKTDEELALQARLLDRMGETLATEGLQLRVHHHAAEMLEGAREWRHILRHTDPKHVYMCIDIQHAHRSGVDPNVLLRESGRRTAEIHLRNTRNGVPTEAFGIGDIDHNKIASTLKDLVVKPLVVIELAYHNDTEITRDLGDNLRLSRLYTEKTFRL